MLTPGELATFLKAGAGRARFELTAATKEFLEHVSKDAKALIGQELPEWPALAPTTVAEKQRLGFTGQVSATDPLLRTGKLRDSIQGGAEATGEGAQGVVGSDDIVARWQEMGTGRTPPRPFLSTAMMRSQPAAEKIFGELGVHLTNPPIR